MARITEIKVPAVDKDGQYSERLAKGYVTNLMVGGEKVRFFIQTEADTDKGHNTQLVHYATGRVVGPIGPIRLMAMAQLGPSNVPNDRTLAQQLVGMIERSCGLDKMLAEFSAYPTINP